MGGTVVVVSILKMATFGTGVLTIVLGLKAFNNFNPSMKKKSNKGVSKDESKQSHINDFRKTVRSNG